VKGGAREGGLTLLCKFVDNQLTFVFAGSGIGCFDYLYNKVNEAFPIPRFTLPSPPFTLPSPHSGVSQCVTRKVKL
jgi:hypothetical protein